MRANTVSKAFLAAVLMVAMLGVAGVSRAAAPAKITSVVTARGYEGGKAQGVSSTFSPQDHVIHCVVKMNKISSVSVGFVWTAVDAAGMKNYKIMEKILPRQLLDQSHGTVSLPRDWPVGSYKVDILLNSKLAKTLPFTIK